MLLVKNCSNLDTEIHKDEQQAKDRLVILLTRGDPIGSVFCEFDRLCVNPANQHFILFVIIGARLRVWCRPRGENIY